MSTYRPSYGNQRDQRDYRDQRDHRGGRRSPPRRSPPSNVYQFGGGDNYRPGGRNDRDAPRNGDRRDDFSFRAGDQDLRFPPADAQRPPRDRAKRPQARDIRRPRQGRGPWRPPAPHERPILRSTREKTPEQLDGMNPGTAKFISLSDVSDSEAEMDLDSGDEDASDDEDRPPAKRVRATTEDKADDGNAAPRWSNPDPYTALPPPDETHAKRRDFVKLIRKAKVAPEHDAAASNAVTKNDDFISLNFDDDEDQQNSDDDENSPVRRSDRKQIQRSFDGPSARPSRATSAASAGQQP
ncbi:Topoisomerase family protein [Neofusicoccum parvum]|nr:Topoisomerase family protein [Neofusicoccum parvum]